MTHQVTIRNTGHRFPAQDGSTILQSALDAGLVLPYGCRDGACGSCKGKLVDGRIDYGRYSERALTAQEREQGYALFCQAKPLSDVVIEAREVRKAGDIQIRKLPARVQKLERAADDAMIVYLKLPANERLMFLPGQYIDILLKDGTRRSFSMANAPHDDEYVQLHVRHVPGGAFTDHVFRTMKERDILRFEGPFGTFFLRDESDKPIVLVASGTGFAPIKALIEAAFKKGVARPMRLYWGARRPNDLYLNGLAERWAAVALDARREFRIGDDAGQSFAQDFHDRGGRGGGREEAEPALAFEFCEARFVDRRHLRKMPRSSGRGHNQTLEAPRLDVLLGRRHVVEQQVEASRHHLLVGGGRAFERHVQRIHAQAPEQDRSPDVLQGPDSRRSVGEPPGLSFAYLTSSARFETGRSDRA